MRVKEAITQLEIIATNMVGRLAETHDEREVKIISKQIDALDMGIDALKTQINFVRCGECIHKIQALSTEKGAIGCELIRGTFYEDFFCKEGERKADYTVFTVNPPQRNRNTIKR